VLLAKRKSSGELPGKWEFPGGKIEAGESPEECIKRELREELGIKVKVGEYITSSEFDYGDRRIKLLVYNASFVDGDFKLSDHEEVKWVNKKDLFLYELAEADKPVLQHL